MTAISRYIVSFFSVLTLVGLVGVYPLPCFPQHQPDDKGMLRIRGGEYTPLYGKDSASVVVGDFYMDKFPVTNSQYLGFVTEKTQWQKSHIKRLFSDERYLAHWKGDTELGEQAIPAAPVTHVSWFAAKKYCEYYGKRLPTMDEWEYVGMSDETLADARTDSNYNRYILEWYEKPAAKITVPVGSTFENYWGVSDMHGLVWEWVLDFNTVLISGESRSDVAVDRKLFCASGAVGATDLMNYAAFMRYAFRGSLEANYTGKNLGFRCARDIEP